MPPKTLHLGCGMEKVKGAIGIDNNPRAKADVIHDLNKFPYPFKKNQFDKVIAENIFEHLLDIPKVMTEIHRIAKPSARLLITTAHFSSVDSFTDPTHVHFFTSRSFDYFIPGTDLYKYQYTNINYKKRSIRVGPNNWNNPLIKVILALINRYLIFYEKRLAFIFPVGVISYDLEVIK